MKTLWRVLIVLLIAFNLMAGTVAFATPAPSDNPAGSVSRTAKAVHYHRGGTVKVDFRPTDLMANAGGEAKIEGKKTNVTAAMR